MEPRIPSTDTDTRLTVGLSTSASTIRSLPQRSPLPSHPPLPAAAAYEPPSPNPSSSSTHSSPSASSSLISLDSNLDSVSSSFFFSSAAASPPHPHPHPHPGTELVIPSLALPAPLLARRPLPLEGLKGRDGLPERKRRRRWRREEGQIARFLVLGTPADLDAGGEEEQDEGRTVVRLRLEGDALVEMVFVGDIQQLDPHRDIPVLKWQVLEPFQALARIFPRHAPLSENDNDDDELISSLIASDASPLYSALLVLPPSVEDQLPEDGDKAILNAQLLRLRRLLPIPVVRLSHASPDTATDAKPNVTDAVPEPSPLSDAAQSARISPTNSLFTFDADTDAGGLASPPVPTVAPGSGGEEATKEDADADDGTDPDPATATLRTHIHTLEATVTNAAHAHGREREQAMRALHAIGLTTRRISELRREAAGLFVDWWRAHQPHPYPQPHPAYSAPASLSDATRPPSSRGFLNPIPIPRRARMHTRAARRVSSISVSDPLHLPSLLCLVRDVVVAWTPRPGLAAMAFVAGVVVGVGVVSWMGGGAGGVGVGGFGAGKA